ncbi:response regulator [Pseudomonas jessenii]|jgi:response regulator of citrate/malate metabolism|uniref:Response regulator n=1 Tax=Pseudomonas jessenii TaxID=77298 RepID=A0A2W0EKS4_PSEJE|nr:MULTISPECIES: response regulator [Pseudomonas]PYY69130.1 response regulator [Pseudomonas jessenii]WPN28614.1 response regulator [Pseudomonas sp. P5_109]
MAEDDLRILVVEDHPFQLIATQCLLESYGFTRLTTTDSAKGAMQQMLRADQPFDILLCDQCLPDLTGLDLVRFASRRGLIRRAIILSSLTMSELDELVKTATEHGLPLLGYLIKPLKQSEFRELLTTTQTQEKTHIKTNKNTMKN